MNPDVAIIVIGSIAALLGLIILSAFKWLEYKERSKLPLQQVIVNVPTTQQLSEPGEVASTISGQRAILWWSVYKATIDWPEVSVSRCIEAANEAVRTTYGELP